MKIQYKSLGIIIKLMVFNGEELGISHHRFTCPFWKTAFTGFDLFECILGSAVLDRKRANEELVYQKMMIVVIPFNIAQKVLNQEMRAKERQFEFSRLFWT